MMNKYDLGNDQYLEFKNNQIIFHCRYNDCLIIYCPDAGEEVILKLFKSLGFDIKMKPLEKASVKDEEPEKEFKEIQSIIA